MRRRFLALALLATALPVVSSCAKASPVDFANRFIAAENRAWSTGDVSDLKALESDDVTYHLPGMDLKGWKAHEDYIQQGRAMVSDLKQNWKYLSGEGNLFVLSYESSAMIRADATTPPAPISVSYLCVFRLNNGKIEEVWMNGGPATPPATESKKE